MNKQFLLIILVLAILGVGVFLLTSGRVSAPDQPVPQVAPQAEETGPAQPEAQIPDQQMEESMMTYTLDEIREHDSANDCWLLIDGKVYDVTGFETKHPGGEALLEGCGIDATELYETRPMGSGTPHSQKARDSLEYFYIGDLE